MIGSNVWLTGYSQTRSSVSCVSAVLLCGLLPCIYGYKYNKYIRFLYS